MPMSGNTPINANSMGFFKRFNKTAVKTWPLIINKQNAPAIAASAAVTALNMGNFVTPYLLGHVIEGFTNNAPTLLFGTEFSQTSIIGIYASAWTLSLLIPNLYQYPLSYMGLNGTNKLLDQYVNYLLGQSLQYHRDNDPSGHYDRINKCFYVPEGISSQLFTQLLPTLIEITIAVGLLSYYYDTAIGGGLAIFVAMFIAANIIANQSTVGLQKKYNDAHQKVYEPITSPIYYHEMIHAFGKQSEVLNEFNDNFNAMAAAKRAKTSYDQKVLTAQNLLSGLGFAIFLIAFVNGMSAGQYTIGDLIFFNSYLAQLIVRLPQFSKAISGIFTSLVDIEKIFDEISKISNVVDHYPLRGLKVSHENASVEFRNVSLTHDENKEDGTIESRTVLRNVSFVANSGEQIGIVGTSGSGKSTISNLLMRFYDTSEGDIFINGQNIKHVSLLALRSAIGIVQQSPILFYNKTLGENIAYGAPDPVSDEQLQVAIKAACLDECINAFSDKLNKKVGVQGSKLSGGELQRVAIARAFLKNACINIVDEPTSALDNATKRKILSELQTGSRKSTTFIITHDLTNLLKADRIIVIENGYLVEQGTHQQLAEKHNGVYAKLWQEQLATMKDAGSDNKSESYSVTEIGSASTTTSSMFTRSKNTLKERSKNPERRATANLANKAALSKY